MRSLLAFVGYLFCIPFVALLCSFASTLSLSDGLLLILYGHLLLFLIWPLFVRTTPLWVRISLSMGLVALAVAALTDYSDCGGGTGGGAHICLGSSCERSLAKFLEDKDLHYSCIPIDIGSVGRTLLAIRCGSRIPFERAAYSCGG